MVALVDKRLEQELLLKTCAGSDSLHTLTVMHFRGFEETLLQGEPISVKQVRSLYSEFAQEVISQLGAGVLALYVSRLDTQMKAVIDTLESAFKASGSPISLVELRMELNYFKLTSQPVAVMTRTADHEGLQQFLKNAKDDDRLGIVHEVLHQARTQGNRALFCGMLASDLRLKKMANSHHCDYKAYSPVAEVSWFRALLTLDAEFTNSDMQAILDYALTESLERVHGEDEVDTAQRFVLSAFQGLPEGDQYLATTRFHKALANRSDSWASKCYYEWLDIPSLFGLAVPDIAKELASGETALNDDQKMALSFLEFDPPHGGRAQTFPAGHDLHQLLKVAMAIRSGDKPAVEAVFRCLDNALREGAEEYGLGGLLNNAGLAEFVCGPSEYELKDVDQAYKFSVRSFFGLTQTHVTPAGQFQTVMGKLKSKPDASSALFTLGTLLGMKEFLRGVVRELNVEKGLPIEDVMKVMRLGRDDVISDIRLKANLFLSELNV